jgi:hypothetical protein
MLPTVVSSKGAQLCAPVAYLAAAHVVCHCACDIVLLLLGGLSVAGCLMFGRVRVTAAIAVAVTISAAGHRNCRCSQHPEGGDLAFAAVSFASAAAAAACC